MQGSTPAERMDNALRTVLRVPKDVVVRKEEKEKQKGKGREKESDRRKLKTMTYKQAAQLFRQFGKGSTWPGTNPRVFHFHRDGGGEYTVDLYEDDGKARYLRVLFSEVRPHV